MNKKISLIILCACGLLLSFLQFAARSPQNLHAHNDYEKAEPFWKAFNAGAGSIEADVFLVDGELLLAHSIEQVKKQKSLDGIYLKPIDSLITSGKSKFSKPGYHLQLMIDIKSEGDAALQALIQLVQRRPALLKSNTFSIVISGNRPPIENYHHYPSFILFDGLPDSSYSADALERIPMFSDNLRHYSDWAGKGAIPSKDREKLKGAIAKVHALGKTIRFWNAPDDQNAWKELINLNVDWLNTDKVDEAASFLTARH